MEKLPIYKVTIDFNDEETGISAIALVESPAIEIDWVAFSKQERIQFAALQDKQMLAGPFLIPDFPIYRRSEKFGEYHIVFDRETIEKLALKFNKQLNAGKFNIEHTDTPAPAFVAENWIVEESDKDKSNKYGFSLPAGTWFGLVKVEDAEYWNSQVKEGIVKGFSVEGMLGLEKIDMGVNIDPREIEFADFIEKNTDTIGISRMEFDTDPSNELGEWVHLDDSDLEQNGSVEETELAAKYKQVTLYSYASGKYGSLGYGPRSRPFCRAMATLTQKKYLTRADINALSDKAGYSVFSQAGGNHCKHYWLKTTTRKKVLSKQMKEITLKDGTKIYSENDIAVDAMVFSDAEMTQALTAGTYEMESGEMFTVAEGKVTEITQPTEQADAATGDTTTTDAPANENATPDLSEVMSALEEIRTALAELNTRVAAIETAEATEDATAEEALTSVKAELASMKELLSKTPGGKSLFVKTDSPTGGNADMTSFYNNLRKLAE